MYRGTTPTLTFRFEEFNPSEAEKIILTFVSGKKTWEYTEADMTADLTSVSITLTQEQTLSYPVGTLTAQLNFLMPDGARFVTKPNLITVERNFYDEVMENG